MGSIGEVHFVKHPSVQHLAVPAQSVSNKHWLVPGAGSGGHSAISGGSGQFPGFSWSSSSTKKTIVFC